NRQASLPSRLYRPKPYFRRLKSQRLGLHHALEPGDLGGEFRRQWLVDLDKRDRRAARLVAAEMEGRDVDLVLAQQGAEPADEAWLVVVGDVKHVRRELCLDLDSLDLDDARMLAAEQGAGDRAGVLLGGHREPD